MSTGAPISPGPAACGGVVVTFFPDAEFEARLGAIAREVSPLLVVDNSADPAVRNRLEAVTDRCGGRFLPNAANLGTAAALNRGFAELARLGCGWAVAFDQDSAPAPGLAGRLRACAGSDPFRPAAVVGANWTDAARDTPALHLIRHPRFRLRFQRVAAGQDLPAVTTVIMSGSLFSLEAWRELGGFDESLFLDLVDSDYCLRAREAGWAVRVAAEAGLVHPRGRKRPVRFCGRTWWPAFMPPPRLYTLFRNRVLLFRRHAWREPHWAAFETAYALKILAEVAFLEDAKLARLGACLRGTGAGIVGRRGIVNFVPPHSGPEPGRAA